MAKKIRVVAYCRVSSDHEDQLNSLENQKQFWEEYYKDKDDYIFVGLYYDEGITGTSVKNRVDFKRMIRDAELKKFDLIATKKVSRFARNTVDCLKYTRHLKERKVGVFFYSDNINTLEDGDAELRLTIMASFAQDESRNISENVKFGHKQAMKNAVVFGADRLFGYNRSGKTLIINEKEAEIVRNIFNWFLNGKSLHQIADILNNELKIKGRLGGKFYHSSIKQMLRNEKYCGDLVQRKSYTEDYLSHKRVMNNDDRYITHRGVVPAIVDRDTWNKVQIKLQKNVEKFNELGIGFTKHVWGGKIICANCGSKFRRKVYKNKDGSDRPVWHCMEYYDNGTKTCPNSSYIREDVLENVFMDIFNKMISSSQQKQIINNFLTVLEKILQNNSSQIDIDNLNKQLQSVINKKQRLLDVYLAENSSMKPEEYNRTNGELNNLEEKIRLDLSTIEHKDVIIQEKKKRIENLYSIVREKVEINKFNKNLVEDYLEKIEVNKKRLKIYLIVGEYDVDLEKYPKRINTPVSVSIMDIKFKYKKGRLNYDEQYQVEVLLYA